MAAIIGTRPEAIKMAPVLRALRTRGIDCALLCTGQHPLLDLHGAGMDVPDVERLGFDPANMDADAMCTGMEALASDWLVRARPSLVLVQGDTNSALAGARAAQRRGIPIGHVEAGLRTGNLRDPWPEERNRIAIDAIADLLFAPTAVACENLAREGVPGRTILSGNSGIDAIVETAREAGPVPVPSRPMILATVHRRENRGDGVRSVARALRIVADAAAVDVVVALHPNAHARAEMVAATACIPRLIQLEPLGYRDMVRLMLRCRLILTDSGGLQEEGAALGIPVLILRASTERAEAIASGNALLVGTEPSRIVTETLRLLHDGADHARMSVPAFPFGAPGASACIAKAISGWLDRPNLRIPHPA